LDNVIVTPHMAGQTKEAASGVSTMAAEGVLAVISGKRWPAVANPAAYDHPRWKGRG
jgi:D-3-phosphoglycerate dehydrogenase